MTKIAAERAARLVGTRFRPQGRSAATGLDCLGLVMAAHRIAPGQAPCDYALRGEYQARFLNAANRWFRRIPQRSAEPGDVLVMRPASDQLHLGIVSLSGFIHADARLGRVVETPGRPGWRLAAILRRRARTLKVAG